MAIQWRKKMELEVYGHTVLTDKRIDELMTKQHEP